MVDAYTGMVTATGNNFAIRNWGFCNGAIVAIVDYQALFSLIGCTYGGDCRTSMGIPDLRGRHAIGLSGTNFIGSHGAWEVAQLGVTNLPAHSHPATDTMTAAGSVDIAPPTSDGPRDSPDPENSYFANFPNNQYASVVGTPGQMGSYAVPVSEAHTSQETLGMTGGSYGVSTRSPYLAITYQICLNGYYPSRN